MGEIENAVLDNFNTKICGQKLKKKYKIGKNQNWK